MDGLPIYCDRDVFIITEIHAVLSKHFPKNNVAKYRLCLLTFYETEGISNTLIYRCFKQGGTVTRESHTAT